MFIPSRFRKVITPGEAIDYNDRMDMNLTMLDLRWLHGFRRSLAPFPRPWLKTQGVKTRADKDAPQSCLYVYDDPSSTRDQRRRAHPLSIPLYTAAPQAPCRLPEDSRTAFWEHRPSS